MKRIPEIEVNDMKKWEKYLDGLLIKGLVDIRKQAAFFSARKLPNGEFGLCLLCLKDNVLNIYDTDMKQNIGMLMYSVDLTKVTNYKASTFMLNSYLKFTYDGYDYKFVDCVMKSFYETVKSEVMRNN